MFFWILFAAFFVCSVSVAVGALVGLRAKHLHLLICYAIGALLGAAFLEILPHAFEETDPHKLSIILLCGILAFFVLEKLVLWRHCHHHHCETHSPTPHRAGLLILIGDAFHNFADGVLIAAAFLENATIGWVTMLAIIAHEIPQEIGDFLILRHSGYSLKRAIVFNFISNATMILGAALAYLMLGELHEILPLFLGVAAASLIYVAMADLIPGLHHKTDLKSAVAQIVLIIFGIASIFAVQQLIGHGHG